VCGTCNSVLEYSKIENAGWCSTCVMWYQLNTAKKETIAFDIPTTVQDIVPDIVSIENNYNDDVSINHTPQPKGVLAKMQEKGLRITNYSESDGRGNPIRDQEGGG
jgi:hypothetical protein